MVSKRFRHGFCKAISIYGLAISNGFPIYDGKSRRSSGSFWYREIPSKDSVGKNPDRSPISCSGLPNVRAVPSNRDFPIFQEKSRSRQNFPGFEIPKLRSGNYGNPDRKNFPQSRAGFPDYPGSRTPLVRNNAFFGFDKPYTHPDQRYKFEQQRIPAIPWENETPPRWGKVSNSGWIPILEWSNCVIKVADIFGIYSINRIWKCLKNMIKYSKR